MNEKELAQNLYKVRDVLFQSRNSSSYLCLFLQGNENYRNEIAAFSNEIRACLTKTNGFYTDYRNKPVPNVFDTTPDGRLTTRLAMFNDALDQFKNDKIESMITYLTRHQDVKKTLEKYIPMLVKLQQDFNDDEIIISEPEDHNPEDRNDDVEDMIVDCDGVAPMVIETCATSGLTRRFTK